MVAPLSAVTVEPPQGSSEEIVRSWRRSALSGVDPARLAPQFVEVETDSAFLRAARPVLESTARLFADTEMSLGLTDARGRIVWRWADNSRLLGLLDRHSVDIGFRFDEELVGTNGAGTVLETGAPVMIGGGEHFADALKVFACFATPVRNPVSGRLAGVLSVSCRAEQAVPLMRATILQLAADIETAAREQATAAQRKLMDRFLQIARSANGPVVAVSEDIMICDRQAGLLNVEHGLLWDRIRTADPANDLPIPGPQRAVGCFELLSDGPRTVGAVVSIREQDDEVRQRTPGDCGPTRTATRETVAQQAQAILDRHARVLVHGETGVGKTTMLAELTGAHDSDVFDATLQPIDPVGWLRRLAARLDHREGGVVLKHLDALPDQVAGTVGSLVRASLDGDGAPRMGVTITTPDAQRPRIAAPLLDLFQGTRLEFPPLRRRTEDIRLLLRRVTNDSGRTLSPQATEAVMRFGWPGNERQLDQLLREIVGAAPLTQQIGLAELPLEMRAAGDHRHRSPLEEAEASVILGVLADCRGNKKEAAQRLGIARGSLYAKLRTYRITDADLLGR